MSNNLHPAFNDIFDSFFAPGQAQAASPTMTAPHVKALPPVTQPVERALWNPGHDLPALIVDYINFPVTHGRRDEWGQMMDPDYPASCEIQAVWLAGHDIYPLLSDEVVESLERYFRPSQD